MPVNGVFSEGEAAQQMKSQEAQVWPSAQKCCTSRRAWEGVGSAALAALLGALGAALGVGARSLQGACLYLGSAAAGRWVLRKP